MSDTLVSNPFARDPKLARLPTLMLFRMGFSTYQIAAAKNKPEHQVYNWLHTARENERRQNAELKAG